MATRCSCRLIPATALLLLLLLVACQPSDAASFVRASGTQLQVDGQPFYHLGLNAYWLPSSAAFGDRRNVDAVLDAAQRLGLKSVRVWGFNDQFPASPGRYSEAQGAGLDYVVAGAGRRGLRVIIAAANFWNAYQSPEKWLAWAEGSADGKTIADLYRSPAAVKLYRDHINALTSRVNSLTGLAYRADPTIMGWNLLNEPRCPGCTAADMAARNNFLTQLTQELQAAAPNQLTMSSTEGYFAPGDPNVGFNPGAGAQCEGEDWVQEIRLVDVAGTHIYYRQLEQTSAGAGGWRKQTFDEYCQFLAKKLQLYTDLAGSSGRPLVVEEFGLTSRYFGDEERKVVFALVADTLIAAKRAGKPLMAALFWNAAAPGQPDPGYSVDVTRTPSGATVGLGTMAARRGVAAASSKAASNASSSAAQASATSSSSSGAGSNGSNGSNGGSPTPTSSSSDSPDDAEGAAPAATGRKLAQVVVSAGTDELDAFRRGGARQACAQSAAASWRASPVPAAVDVAAYRALVRGHDIVDILAEVGRLLSE